MPQCSFHPGVETEVRCTECERYICPKDMVPTPVGYKCPVCAKPARSQYVVVKPGQLLRAILIGGAVGVGGGIILALVPLFGIFGGLFWGLATAEATRRASGGHREWSVGIVAIAAIALGGFAGMLITGRLNALAIIIAVVVALVDLALLEFR
ncbi:MAG TPA: hypothetical protein VIL41_02390 [Coriobacteriia bacterium]